MLFTFNTFWKVLLTVAATWGAYGVLGFEFTTVTLLALLLGASYRSDSIVI